MARLLYGVERGRRSTECFQNGKAGPAPELQQEEAHRSEGQAQPTGTAASGGRGSCAEPDCFVVRMILFSLNMGMFEFFVTDI